MSESGSPTASPIVNTSAMAHAINSLFRAVLSGLVFVIT